MQRNDYQMLGKGGAEDRERIDNGYHHNKF
jgi:hypothetical protein